MKIKHFSLTVALVFALLHISTAGTTSAEERWLVPDTSQCGNTTINPCYLSLADAVNQAASNDSIRILPGTYVANVTITGKNITIFGDETARTFLTGNGDTIITVSGVNSPMEIKNITFFNASPAILVNNASAFSVEIKNNIFEVANTATAIQVSDSANPLIMNNTFYRNGTAIQSAQAALYIVNNIFFNNTPAISTTAKIDNIYNNLFFPSGSAGPANIIFDDTNIDYKGNLNGADPKFVPAASDSDITKRDFHLQIGTPCEMAGTDRFNSGPNSINGFPSEQPDIGAYGGPFSDTIPYLVSGVTGSAVPVLGDYDINLTWSLNECYMVSGYEIFYSVNRAGAPYDNGATPLDAGNVASFPYPLVSVAALLPAPPSLITPPVLTSTPSNETLTLAWTPVSGATGYNLYYKERLAGSFIPVLVGNATTYTLTGLKNPAPDGTKTYYDIYVEPYYQASFFIAVKPYYDTSNSMVALVYSNELNVPVGPAAIGAPSALLTDYPEPIIANPDLPNKGCFIATAAYGYYSAPQVQALREFRDRYLMRAPAGRAFVTWYYRYGPIGAEFLNTHSWLKPAVRVALAPAVGGALFMTRTSLFAKMIVLLLVVGLSSCLILHRRKLAQSGGPR